MTAPTAERVLDAMPSLGASYGAVLGRTARAMVTRERVPTALPDVTFRVDGVRPDPERLTAYARLVGESAGDALPAGSVHVLAFPLAMAVMVREDFPLRPLGLVHVANSIAQLRPVTLADSLRVRAWAERLEPHRSGTQVDLVAEVSTLDDGVAWRGRSTYLAKGVRLAGLGAPPEAEAPAELVAPAPTGEWRLPADTGRRYAAVSGDRNPIHTSSLAARAFGFPRAIAHGMYTAARALATVGPARGDAFDWDVEFGSPVLLPGTVSVRVAPLAGDQGSGSVASDARAGYGVVGWNARSGKRHLDVRVTPRR
ncbi:MaoC domain protein dehydratase [Beutenbergia cavernae DSM 12333]|uniref:MaoC domain protein dehydratase n=1 Tax=Beutenbergia cavernae (strain ATCC BAA-8 / DSM 12333 / CCUG 43141 / JCM 11478 / NBRC 16432 / NCIMB 13614 / HKI 0122) TaxID=471853 RepID=C5C2Y5_BEUC1|nr:MaoC/PaaZ C-terminal domain-containing protein [Beutenbergia cavernae]ACQ81829.1 MaoC domain protein dehydratase [Beutenbergia cavernae DSM 12333]